MLQATSDEHPPAGTQTIRRWLDLPDKQAPAVYIIRDDAGDERRATISRNARRLLEGLRRGPVLCASPCRLSDMVLHLKRTHGLSISTKMYANDRATDRTRYGVYFLASDVSLAAPEAAQ